MSNAIGTLVKSILFMLMLVSVVESNLLLQQEIEARLQAERRLRDAEDSLNRIEASIQQKDVSTATAYEDVMGDVKTLKSECLIPVFRLPF